MANFSEVINELIIYKNLNQRKVCISTNIATTVISEYCSGTMPNIPNLIKLANYFNCSCDYLLGIVEEDKKSSFDNDYEYSYSIFYDRFIKLVESKNISLYSLSKHLNIHKNTIYNWKNGINPSCNTLIKLADFLGTSVDYLVGRSENK